MEHRFETFTSLVTNLNRSIRKIKGAEMQSFNLKSPYVSCLYYLFKMGPLTAKELCDLCAEDKANMSRHIDYLEKNEYLICRTKLQKRYKTPIELTEKGMDVGEHIANKIDHVLFAASEGVSEENRRIMYESLAIVSRNLQKISKEYGEG